MALAAARKAPSKIYDIQAHSNKVTCLDIGVTGRVLVTGGQDRNVNLWTFGSKECFMSLNGHNAPIDCVKFAYSDDYVYSADDTGIIKRWDLNSDTECTTFFGHMKTVRTLDFHPYSEYVVSGSHDTSIRLWDVRQNVCIKRYRGHISHVNSVKFSPDGLWIASAGTEGCVIIWDIRMSKQFMEFTERESPAICVQYHPSDLLMAAGRNDGTVDLYDLEKKQLVSRADKTRSKGHPVKCISFDEGGSCLFVGTAAGISVIGWEPDQEYDHVDSTWTSLGDMITAGKKLICGTYENRNVSIHAVNLTQVKPFFNPQNQPFNHHQSSRKSFSRGSGKVRLSIGDRSFSGETIEENTNGGMSPNLSIEMIDEEGSSALAEKNAFDFSHSNGSGTVSYESFTPPPSGIPVPTITPPSGPLSNSNYLVKEEMKMYNISTSTGYSSDLDYYPLKNNPADADKEDFPVKSAQPPDYAPKMTTNSSTISSSSNTSTSTKSTLVRQKTESVSSSSSSSVQQRRPSQPNLASSRNTFGSSNLTRKISTSRSTLELNKLGQDEQVTFKKPISRGSSPIRNNTALSSKIRKSESTAQINNMKNATNRYSHNANVKIEIVTKPVRSKTSLDMRQRNTNGSDHHNSSSATMSRAGIIHHNSSNGSSGGHSLTHIGIHDSGGGGLGSMGGRDSILMPPPPIPPPSSIPTATHHNIPLIRYPSSHDGGGGGGAGMTSNEEYEIQLLMNEHDSVFQALCNRTALLSAIRNYTQSGDVNTALKVAVRMNDQPILVDLLGAILEKSSHFTLDMCVLLLPKIYDLLQSDLKFHCTRACDTLRVVLTTFLPVIRENTDPWGACTIGVDVSREERVSKCMECKTWLLRIRTLPENPKIGTNLQQLQNMMVDL